jgi:ABC-2 type transport system ATP-binding protein
MRPADSALAFRFEQVGKVYCGARGSFKALDGVSFAIEQGEFFGLLGPNGAGKTTLIGVLASPRAPAPAPCACSVTTWSARTRPRARRSLGDGAAGARVRPVLQRCARRCASPRGYFGLRRNDAWIDEVLAELGLADKADANMRQLSGGMKRRVLVAQALVHPAAGDRAGRAHGRGGRGAAPDAVAVRARA